MELPGVEGDEVAERTLEGDIGGEKAEGRTTVRDGRGGDDMIVSVCVTETGMAGDGVGVGVMRLLWKAADRVWIPAEPNSCHCARRLYVGVW